MKILVLAGGYDQIGLITELKKRGHEVLLADYFENPPAKKVADKHYQISTLDIDAVKKVAVQEKVDLITTACTDQALLTVAKVSEELKLPTYINYDKALKVTNKKYMKEQFETIGVPTAKSKVFATEEDFFECIENIKYPSVVKPCDCNSSKGVTKVTNVEELKAAVNMAFTLSRSHLVIVEDYIEGVEVSIDIWVDAEGAKVLSVSETDKIANGKDSFTIYKSKYPVEITETAYENICKVADLIAEGFDLADCPILIQAIVVKDDVYVIEFSARMGGGTKYKLIEYMSGINIMEVYVNRILGNTKQIVNPVPSSNVIELNYVYAHNGIYGELKNFEVCKNTGEIVEYFQYKEAGAVIEKAKTSSDRVVGFLLIEKSIENMELRRNSVINKVDVLDENGKSIMLKSIFGGKSNE